MREQEEQYTPEQEDAIVAAASEQLGRLQEELEQLHRLSGAADEAAQHNIFGRHLLGKATNTRRMYQVALAVFTTFLAEHGVTLTLSLAEEPRLWQAISSGLVLAFQLWLIKGGYALKTANDYLGVIKTYAGLAHDAGVMDDGTYIRIGRIPRISGRTAERINLQRREQGQPTRKGYKKAMPAYFEEEHQHLLSRFLGSVDRSTPQGARDLVALLLLYDLGLRPGEAIALRLSDLDLPRNRLHVHRYKTGVEQYLALSEALLEAIHAYLKVRRDWVLYQARPCEQTDAPLLVQSRKNKQLVEACDLAALRKAEQEGTPLTGARTRTRPRKVPLPASADWSTQHLWDRVHQLSIAAGLPPLAPYDARHQWTYEAVAGGTPHPVILQAGGWKSGSRMVERYYGRHEVANRGIKLGRNWQPREDGE